MSRVLRSVAGVMLATARAAAAQGDCFPGPGSNEAEVLGVKSVALAFAPGLAASSAPDRAGAVRLALETSYVPTVDDETATPTICRPGKGPENADLIRVLVRPRAMVTLPAAFRFEASWIPPVRVADVKANLFGFALARVTPLSDGISATLRVHATVGRIRAPITCPEKALADPASECFRGTVSDDRLDPTVAGVDLTLGFGGRGARVRAYAGAGYNRLEPRFQVNFTNAAGSTDRRKVTVDLNRGVVFGGVSWAWTPGLGVSGEVYAAPTDAVTARVVLQAGWRGGR